ncbi:MAG: hypothetical protein ACI841_002806, partial [Planctomycetota bacterium]
MIEFVQFVERHQESLATSRRIEEARDAAHVLHEAGDRKLVASSDSSHESRVC